MNVTYSQIEAEVRESIDKECARHIEKLNRLLKRYDPDLVQLHCTLEKTPHRIEFALFAKSNSAHRLAAGDRPRLGRPRRCESRIRRNRRPGKKASGKVAQGLHLETKASARRTEAR